MTSAAIDGTAGPEASRGESEPPAALPEDDGEARRAELRSRSDSLFAGHMDRLRRRADRISGFVLVGVGVASVVRTFAGVWTRNVAVSVALVAIALQVLAAGLVVAGPLYAVRTLPGRSATRQIVALAHVALLLVLFGSAASEVEARSYVACSLAFLALYRDPKVLLTATVLFSAELLAVAGWRAATTADATAWSALPALDHVAWMFVEDAVLLVGGVVSAAEMRSTADLFVALELTREELDRQFSAARELETQARLAEVEQRQLEELVETRSQFLATMSHELRTPLHGVIGFIELLTQASLAEPHAELVRGARASARHMIELVNDVLDHAKIESGRLEIEPAPMDLVETLHESVAVVRGPAADKGLTLDVSIAASAPRWVLGDKLRFRQILVNLVGNAVKFTQRGGVRVRLRAHESSAQLVVDVEDDGPGIDESRRARIFEPYRQGDESLTRRHGGTGLGLAISRQLARAMGGELSVESSMGAGATFRLCVPLSPVEAPARPGSSSATLSAAAPAVSLRVLLADDNVVNRLIGRRLLESVGHRVDVVEDGDTAVTAVRTAEYDVILMDVEMPRLDGHGATRAIRAAGFSGTILGFTAHTSLGHAERCRASGMNGILNKPLEMTRLVEALDAASAERARALEGAADG